MKITTAILSTHATKNNRVYPLKVLESIRDQINSRNKEQNLGTIGYPEGLEVSLSQAAFKYSNAHIINEFLWVDIETIHTPQGVEFRKMWDNEIDLRFRPGGIGTLKSPMVEDYQLITIAAITPEEDAVNF